MTASLLPFFLPTMVAPVRCPAAPMLLMQLDSLCPCKLPPVYVSAPSAPATSPAAPVLLLQLESHYTSFPREEGVAPLLLLIEVSAAGRVLLPSCSPL